MKRGISCTICNWSDNPPVSPWQKKIVTRQVMLELFFDSNGIVHMEFIPDGATVNKTRYKEILGCLHNSIHLKHPELWWRKNWLLLHDNTPAHHSVLVQEELIRQQVTVLSHLHTHLILHHVILVSFPAWKHSYVGIDFIQPKGSWLPQGKLYGIFLPTCFSHASSSYTNVGRRS